MTHPLELQRRNMIEYEQIDNEGNHILQELIKMKTENQNAI